MALFSKLKYLATVLLLLTCTPSALYAATVLHVDLEYLLDEAALIFEGEVIASQAQWNDDNSRITTFITFQVDDTIKGNAGDRSLTLGFAGGTVDDTTLRISGMVYPAVGEKGIYFFEDPSKSMLNPLLGWGQGHFRLRADSAGEERVLTEDDAPVMGVDETTDAGSTVARGIVSEPFSQGVAKGILTGGRDQSLSAAMDKEQFKESLRTRLQGKRTPKTSGESK